jgi:hypothetical protein
MNDVYVHGFPGLYGGAGTELHHQILAWLAMKLRVHIIPTNAGYKGEPLYKPMLDAGVIIHEHDQFSAIEKDAPVLGFCNAEFLQRLPAIAERTRNTVFVNCMTWLFDKEKEAMKQGLIGAFLYQNDEVMANHKAALQPLNPGKGAKFLHFAPYFDSRQFPFVEKRDPNFFGVGRVSRQDTDKFSQNTLHIWEYFVSPREKRGYMLGFDKRSEGKIGKAYWWVTTYVDQHQCSQQEFYKKCDIILQPMDTTENWPRIGFEAMSSGSVLIVDNRGGWKKLVKHGVTGWLCNTQQEFIYYASRMAFEPQLRKQMARAARAWGEQLGSLESSMKSWKKVFNELP